MGGRLVTLDFEAALIRHEVSAECDGTELVNDVVRATETGQSFAPGMFVVAKCYMWVFFVTVCLNGMTLA